MQFAQLDQLDSWALFFIDYWRPFGLEGST